MNADPPPVDDDGDRLITTDELAKILRVSTSGSNEPWLFPGGSINSKDAHLFGIQISDRIEKLTGVRITIHQFRHAAAAIYLKHHPGHYETVRQFLGHRNIRTTVNIYCALESIHATRQFGDLIRKRLIKPERDNERRTSA
jgi:integrase